MRRLLVELGMLVLLALIIAGAGAIASGAAAHAQPVEVLDAGGSQTPSDAPVVPAPDGEATSDSSQPTAGDGATPPAEPDVEPTAGNLAAQLLAAVRSGHWVPAFGLSLMLLIAGLRTFALGSWIPWLKTRRGGYVLAFGTATVAVVGAALAAGEGFTLGLLGVAIGAGWAAMGAYESVRDLSRPKTLLDR